MKHAVLKLRECTTPVRDLKSEDAHCSAGGTRNDGFIWQVSKIIHLLHSGFLTIPEILVIQPYAHARGYGLFSVNNLGQNTYDPETGEKSLESVKR